jgi:hypothetical protein
MRWKGSKTRRHLALRTVPGWRSTRVFRPSGLLSNGRLPTDISGTVGFVKFLETIRIYVIVVQNFDLIDS